MPTYKCGWPTCFVKLKSPGHCSAHKQQRKQTLDRIYDTSTRDKEMKKFYDSAAWKRCRGLQLQRASTCQICNRATATTVHHTKPAKMMQLGERLDPLWLQSCCTACHARLERAQREGKQADRYTVVDWDSLRRQDEIN